MKNFNTCTCNTAADRDIFDSVKLNDAQEELTEFSDDAEKPEAAQECGGPVDPLVSCADMVRDYLTRNGYDGLVDDGRECGCCLEDLMPCGGEYAMTCEAGYRVDGCTNGCGNGCDFHIFPGRDHRDT